MAGCFVVIRHPVSDQDMAARQERLARRAREQGCMYHI
jgi:NAD-dependent oxidoreductase involved in siderophore biosynthesis